MSRDRTIEAFVLKKQDYNEADQIITLFSKEEGKIRALVKAANQPNSKLRPALQPLFQSMVTLTGSSTSVGLMKVIRAQPKTVYGGILEDEAKLSAWYISAELIMRSLPDSAPNEILFSELEKFAQFLHSQTLDPVGVKKVITQFQIKALNALGLGIRMPEITSNMAPTVQFSIDRGGFVADSGLLDGQAVSKDVFDAFLLFKKGDYSAGQAIQTTTLESLQKLVTRFVTYQLEREIKSQRYMV